MLKIRLKRVGRKHDPSFRIVVTESTRGPKTGNYVEMLGSYDPRKDNPQVDIERTKYWISKGAQASGTVHNILVDQKVVSGKKINVLPRKHQPPKAGASDEAGAKAGGERVSVAASVAVTDAEPAAKEETPT